MKGCSVLLGGLLAITTSVAFPADPDFKDYTVTPVFTGINHEPVPQEHSNPMMDMDRAQALKGKVNFAGHYILYRVGCGGSAICDEVLDASTGEVVGGLPNAYDGNTFSLSNKPDSRLLIVSGIAADTEEDAKGNELESRYRTRYFEFVNNEFRLLTFKDL
ncbi:hypothetical protein CKQ80_14495 [Pseudomonas moraviensis]|uniref:Uncharacterized protein n=1 Tax=Pseudomonas moraviensis TaxID=321662 RepID=A0A2A2PLX6_9PSED|nr:hypothetical protein [Pseudomonas moraviensis]PAW53412.1 hypothetical protein CKQ68_14715 [Pseudomonas moraviensis]PAW56464.1 hypothetical protein CKQ80_14495 [Pseudomonas moraviensis]